MLRTAEAHLSCEIRGKLLGFESDVAIISVNVLLLGVKPPQMITFFSQTSFRTTATHKYLYKIMVNIYFLPSASSS